MSDASWTIIKEIGIEYAARSNTPEGLQLRSPVYAAKARDGTYLIVDEQCAEKPIPFRMEYRSIRLDSQGRITWDSKAQGIDDGYGCLFDDDCVAILRRTQWELILLSPQGTIRRRIDLVTLSKYLPRVVTATHQGTFLIVFLDRSRRLDIVEIDRDGRLLWFLPQRVDYLGVPASVQRTSTDTLLIADAFLHVVWELDRDGSVVWQFGEPGEPARTLQRVSGATCARALPDGRCLITDTRNHRLLHVNIDKTALELELGEGALCDPTFADISPDDHLLICDSGNGRVIELDNQREIVWQCGTPIRTKRHLCFPRSVAVSSAGEYVIADTANDRIVTTSNGIEIESVACPGSELFWPRCVRPMPSGTMLIADGRHGRIIEMTTAGRILKELVDIQWHRASGLQDPHDVRVLANGHLLIADSPQDVVLEVDWLGNVYREIGDDTHVPLADPHTRPTTGRW